MQVDVRLALFAWSSTHRVDVHGVECIVGEWDTKYLHQQLNEPKVAEQLLTLLDAENRLNDSLKNEMPLIRPPDTLVRHEVAQLIQRLDIHLCL